MGGYSGQVLAIVAGCAIIGHLGWLVVPVLLPEIIADLTLSPTQAGFGLTLLLVVSALLRYPGGRLADQLSRKTILLACLFSWLIGFSSLMVAGTYVGFLIGMAVLGMGLGAFIPTAFATLDDVFDTKQGRAYGLTESAIQTGGVLAAPLAIGALVVGSWRVAFIPLIGTIVLLAVVLSRWNTDPIIIRTVNLDLQSATLRVIYDRRVWPLLAVTTLFTIVFQGTIGFLPTFLELDRELSSTTTRIAYTSMFLAGAVTAPISGSLSDRLGSYRAMITVLSIATTGLAITIFASGLGIFLGVVLFGIGVVGYWPVLMSTLMVRLTPASKAGDFGIFSTIYMAIGSFGPSIVGYSGEHHSYTLAFLGLTGLLGLCVVLVAGMWIRSISNP